MSNVVSNSDVSRKQKIIIYVMYIAPIIIAVLALNIYSGVAVPRRFENTMTSGVLPRRSKEIFANLFEIGAVAGMSCRLSR